MYFDIAAHIATKVQRAMAHFDAAAQAWRAGDPIFSVGESIATVSDSALERTLIGLLLTPETWDATAAWCAAALDTTIQRTRVAADDASETPHRA